jgi:hypothetical protein
VTKLFGLVILTQKEVVQLAKEERGLGYRAGLKSKWRARTKELSIPDKYGDSLPVKLPGSSLGAELPTESLLAGVTDDPDLTLPST